MGKIEKMHGGRKMEAERMNRAGARSDLAAECGCERDGEGVLVTRMEADGCEILRVQVKEAGAQRIGKPCGRYVTMTMGAIHQLDEIAFESARRALAVEIREMAERMTGKRVRAGLSVLVAGLGNAMLTPDAVGPETVKHLSVTRHLGGGEGQLFGKGSGCDIAAVCPGVPGQTGMESAEMIKGTVGVVKPDLVLAVDALAAREEGRLATTVQLSDTGIHPGSGVVGGRKALNRETLGVPVLAIGVPTVVDAATMVMGVLSAAGVCAEQDEIGQAVSGERPGLVTPADVDILIPSVGILLAGAIEKAFSE